MKEFIPSVHSQIFEKVRGFLIRTNLLMKNVERKLKKANAAK